MHFSPVIVNQLQAQYQRMLRKYLLLYGYGLIAYSYSPHERRMCKMLQLYSGNNDTLVQDLERFIPALSSKALANFRQAEDTQRLAINPKDMLSGESFLTVVTPTDCLILGFKGGDPVTNHGVVKEMLSIIADSEDGLVTYPEPPLQFGALSTLAAAI